MTRDEAISIITRAVNEAIAADGTVGAAYLQALVEGWEVTGMELIVTLAPSTILTAAPSGIEQMATECDDAAFLRQVGIGGDDDRN